MLLAGFLDLAMDRADRLERPEVVSVLVALIQATLQPRPRSIEILNAAAVRAARLHGALQGIGDPPDVETIVTAEIARAGPQPGVDALALAEQLCGWLHQMNPDSESEIFCQLHEEGYYTSQSERDCVRVAFPSRLVVGGRVFVSDKVRHREGASPRNGESLCRCAHCAGRYAAVHARPYVITSVRAYERARRTR